MSFYHSSNKNQAPSCRKQKAGECHTEAVSVQKIIDCCRVVKGEQKAVLTIKPNSKKLTCNLPQFIEAHSTSSIGKITHLKIEPLKDNKRFATISCNVTVKMQVIYKTNNLKISTAASLLTVPVEAVLYYPRKSLTDIYFVAECYCSSTQGTAINEHSFAVNVCQNIILKEVANVDLIIPTYGYVQVPNAHNCRKTHCQDFFELPLYPE
ncbi:MAG: hypothetical protein FWD32_02040 [Firmicutes bacterium]|nr:hypothetical protein [Bacillota bacterium]